MGNAQKRYLLCHCLVRGNIPTIVTRAFSVSENTKADEVTVPLNTVIFAFVHSNAKNAQVLEESFATIMLGPFGMISSSIPGTTQEGKVYVVGEVVTKDSKQFVQNNSTYTLLPLHTLEGKDFEVIDL